MNAPAEVARWISYSAETELRVGGVGSMERLWSMGTRA